MIEIVGKDLAWRLHIIVNAILLIATCVISFLLLSLGLRQPSGAGGCATSSQSLLRDGRLLLLFDAIIAIFAVLL